MHPDILNFSQVNAQPARTGRRHVASVLEEQCGLLLKPIRPEESAPCLCKWCLWVWDCHWRNQGGNGSKSSWHHILKVSYWRFYFWCKFCHVKIDGILKIRYTHLTFLCFWHWPKNTARLQHKQGTKRCHFKRTVFLYITTWFIFLC